MPITNLKQFNAKLKAAAVNLTQVQLVLFQKKIALDLLKGVTEKTPVDTGRARGGWQLTINQIPSGELEFSAVNKTSGKRTKAPSLSEAGQDQFNANVQELAKLKPFSVVYISNNVSYITYLENGTSSQAPSGMVLLTLQELSGMF